MLHKVIQHPLRPLICVFLAFCLIIEYPVLAYGGDGGDYTSQGIDAAKQALNNAGSSAEAIGQAAKNGEASVNVPGLAQPLEIPLATQTNSFRQDMVDNASGWTSGNYDPAQAGQDMENAYALNPASANDYSASMTQDDKSQWGNNLGYNTAASSFTSAPYDASAYANDNYIWQPYYDLWTGDNSYVDDLSSDLDCSETVTTECHDETVQDCREDACIGFDTPGATSCLVYYDDNGVLHNECSDYENNPGCILLSEECDGDDQWACGGLSCWANGSCSVPSGHGGNIDSCCAATRVYLCIDCSQVGGTPDPNWTQCPDDWKVHGTCTACLAGVMNAIPVISFGADGPIQVRTAGDHFLLTVETDYHETRHVTVTVNGPEYFTGQAELYLIRVEDSGSVKVEGNLLHDGDAVSCCPQDCSCGERDGTDYSDHIFDMSQYLTDNTTSIEVTDCGGGSRSWTDAYFRFYVTKFYYCENGAYQYNPNTGRCELHKQGSVIQGESQEEDCQKFKDDPNCHLVSSQCVKDEDGNPAIDDGGNCYLYQYKYRCCGDIGTRQICETSSSIDCGGLSCIGFGCRPEFDDTNTNPNNAEKASWFMTYAPFSEGTERKCVKKSLQIIARSTVDCCDLADQMTVGPVTYFQLAGAGMDLYRQTTTFLKRADVAAHATDYDAMAQWADVVQFEPNGPAAVIPRSPDLAGIEPTTQAMSNTGACTYLSSVFQYMDVATFVLNPDPIQLVTDPALRDITIKLAQKYLVTAARQLLGESAAETLGSVLTSAASGTLGTVLSGIGTAIAVYQTLQLIATLLLGGCEDDEMDLAVKKKLGLCHYVGSYKEKSGVPLAYSKKEIYRVYCCFRSPSIRIMMEQVRQQVGGWGTPTNPNCSQLTPDQLAQIDWSQIKMDQIEAYRGQAAMTTNAQIVEQGQGGGYGVQYISPQNPDEQVPTRTYQTLDDAGQRTHAIANALQKRGFTEPH